MSRGLKGSHRLKSGNVPDDKKHTIGYVLSPYEHVDQDNGGLPLA